MMALSATSRDGLVLQGYSLGEPSLTSGPGKVGLVGGFGAQASLVTGPYAPGLVGAGATSLMGLGADGSVATTALPLLGLVLGAAVSAGVTSWMFSASRGGSNLKPGLVAGGTYLAGGLLIALLARTAV